MEELELVMLKRLYLFKGNFRDSVFRKDNNLISTLLY